MVKDAESPFALYASHVEMPQSYTSQVMRLRMAIDELPGTQVGNSYYGLNFSLRVMAEQRVPFGFGISHILSCHPVRRLQLASNWGQLRKTECGAEAAAGDAAGSVGRTEQELQRRIKCKRGNYFIFSHLHF